jgi:hypothetical protein
VLGVYLGRADDVAGPDDHNPTGYREHKGIRDINNELLSLLGCDYSRAGSNWTQPPLFPDGWQKQPQLEALKERALKIIARDFGHSESWGWKDPRTCLTLPFWQDILPSLRYIICIRNPVDVARSQMAFLNCSLERGLYLWLVYLEAAFRYSAGCDRILIQTESWIDDPERELGRLARFIGCPELVDNEKVLAHFAEIIDRRIWHGTAPRALLSVLGVYREMVDQAFSSQPSGAVTLAAVAEEISSEAQRADDRKEQLDHIRWKEQRKMANAELSYVVPAKSQLIVVDEGELGEDFPTGRHAIPFMERDGQYWGRPSDDNVALEEIERLRQKGATYIAFAWPAHWWLQYYTTLSEHLRSKYHCILQNQRLVVFDLRV